MNLKGIEFARAAQALAVAGPTEAADWAAHRWGQNSKSALVAKAAIGAGSTDTMSAFMGDYRAAAADFMELVRAESIIGRLPGLRRVPNNTPYLKATGSVSVNWVAEGKPMPLSSASFTRNTIALLKLAALTVQTDELLKSPDADRILRDDMVAATRDALDQAFIDPANAGVADEQPASITNGITPIAATGTLKADLDAMISAFGGNLTRAVFVGKPQLFTQISGSDYPNIGARGGEIAGIPAIASNSVPNDGTGDYQLALIDPGMVIYTGMTDAYLKTSNSGAIEMDTAPTQDAMDGTAAELVPLFQVGATAIAALIEANWERQRDDAVVILSGLAGAETA